MHTFVPNLLVLSQFFCIFFLASIANYAQFVVVPALLFVSGLAVGLVAVNEMRKSKFSFFPHVKPGAKLVTGGIYRYIRHPMYLAVLGLCLSFLCSNFSVLNALVFFILFLTLYLKILLEEVNLLAVFPQYASYIKKSKRLLPFIW